MLHAPVSEGRIGGGRLREPMASAAHPPSPIGNQTMLRGTRPAIGNQAALRTLRPPRPPVMQRKLEVGRADDPLEHEADRVAEQVMRMPDPEVSVGPASPQLSRKCAACEEEEKLQKKVAGPSNATAPAPAIVHEVLRSPGAPLDAATREFMEPRFGRNFGEVRLHFDGTAAHAAHAVQARAYTVGSDIVFGADEYAPETRRTRRLLAHELTHVLQQTGGHATSPRDLVQRTSTSCSEHWMDTVKGDHNKALELTAKTVELLQKFPGDKASEDAIRKSIARNFNVTDPASQVVVASYISLILALVSAKAKSQPDSYDCEDRFSHWCQNKGDDIDTLAESDTCKPDVSIRVCFETYFRRSQQRRGEALVHEWLHKFGCLHDVQYAPKTPEEQKTWDSLSLKQTAVNPDSFRLVVDDLNPEAKK